MAFTMEFGTGFEMGALTRAGRITSPTPGATARTGTYGVRANNTALYPLIYTRSIPSSEVYLGVWVRFSGETAARYATIQVVVGGAVIAELRHYDTPMWQAYVNGALVENGSVAVNPSTWHHIQLHYLAADAGVFETIIDGVPDISYSGDTQPGASDQISGITLGSSYSSTYLDVDDLAIGTGGWPGDIRFDPIFVDGDVAGECDWSPSAGSDHYALVDEVPPSSADYVYAREDLGERYATPGTWDDTDGLGNVVKDPLAVIVWADARKQDGNQDDKLSLVQSDGTNEVAQAAESLLTSYENRWQIRELAPDGGEWTTAKVNTLVIGLEADVEEVE